MYSLRPLLFALIVLLPGLSSESTTAAEVRLRRVPEGGVQPAVAVEGRRVHLIYLKGDPSRCDIFYVRSDDGGDTWSAPIHVNSQSGSAIAIGTVRGAQLALGREGSIHVAWMGSGVAEPKAHGGAAPMLYTRMPHGSDTFEPQRNVIQAHPGLDGGGSIAADIRGNVWVAWHAPLRPKTGEQNRRLWLARSTDDGATFQAEVQLSDPATGACGCCGMTLLATDQKIYALYRGAAGNVNRGMYCVEAEPALTQFKDRLLAPMTFGACIMSTSALAATGDHVLGAWETRGKVYWAALDANSPGATGPHPIEGGENCKHPAIACGSHGQVGVAWTEGTAWNRGGTVAWQIFDEKGQPSPGGNGREANCPAWDKPALFCCFNGDFVILY